MSGKSPSSSLCNCCVPWLGEGFSPLFPDLRVLRYLLPDGVFPVLVYFVSPSSRQSPSRSIQFAKMFGGDTRCPSVVLYSILTCPGRAHLSVLTYSIMSLTFVYALIHMFFFLSRYVMFYILLFIFVCAATLNLLVLVFVSGAVSLSHGRRSFQCSNNQQ